MLHIVSQLRKNNSKSLLNNKIWSISANNHCFIFNKIIAMIISLTHSQLSQHCSNPRHLTIVVKQYHKYKWSSNLLVSQYYLAQLSQQINLLGQTLKYLETPFQIIVLISKQVHQTVSRRLFRSSLWLTPFLRHQ